jgi:hypothetical protein
VTECNRILVAEALGDILQRHVMEVEVFAGSLEPHFTQQCREGRAFSGQASL